MSDSLSAWAITESLNTRFVGKRLLYYDSIGSTMEVARDALRQGAPEGTVIVADEQTAGRGRLQRAWLTPKGNIAMSIILHPALPNLPAMIMLASLAVVHAVHSVIGIKPEIKWPNDILINGRKVAGILIENDFQGNKVAGTIIGIGVDVDLRLTDYTEIKDIATSLSDEAGREVSRLKVLRYLLVEIENLYLAVCAGGSLFGQWRDNLVTLGKQVRATAGDTFYEGTAESVAEDGSLMLREANGNLIRIVAGDVTPRG